MFGAKLFATKTKVYNYVRNTRTFIFEHFELIKAESESKL